MNLSSVVWWWALQTPDSTRAGSACCVDCHLSDKYDSQPAKNSIYSLPEKNLVFLAGEARNYDVLRTRLRDKIARVGFCWIPWIDSRGGRPIKLPCRISLPNRRTGDNRLAQPNDPFRIRLARRQISQNVNKIELNFDGQRTAVYCDSP